MSKLAKIRKEKKLSQNDLVKISGVNRNSILKYENGDRDINKASGIILFKIASALNCKMEDLLEKKDEIIEDVMFNLYKEWRKEIKGQNKWQEKHGGSLPVYGSVDCGEQSVREDFSNYAKLENEISFDDMLKLEQRYEG